MPVKQLVVIAGPTAVGKTAVAIRLAQHFNTEIISADSRQCYRELNIGVARPSTEELASVPHHFVASHSIHEEVNAAVFAQYANEKLQHIFEHADVAIVCGGTGLYLNALLYGLDAMPAIDAAVRQAVRTGYEAQGLVWLQQQVQQEDPNAFAAIDVHNPHRLMRALEVVRSTGKSIKTFHQEKKLRTDVVVKAFLLELPKEELHQHINSRVDAMIDAGLLNEAQQLLPWENLAALQTVGYAEMFDYLHGNLTLEGAIEKIKRATRQYAKRQITWFGRNALYQATKPDLETVLRAINNPLV